MEKRSEFFSDLFYLKIYLTTQLSFLTIKFLYAHPYKNGLDTFRGELVC